MADEAMPPADADELPTDDTSPTAADAAQWAAWTTPSASGAGEVPPPTPSAEAAHAEEAPYAPFEGEREVMGEGVAMRDDITVTQSDDAATRTVSANHIASLLYRPIDEPGGAVYESQHLERRIRSRRS
ncbi:MAG: hypothetical protein IVW57_14065 [Ktedonobacterales bacterium]|nr:hypothetical protein [Ktedonobacterales bacterium]